MVDLSSARAPGPHAAERGGIELGEQFHLSRFSYVAAAGDDAVLKVAWEGDDEALHEADALELWDGDGAVRVLRRDGRVLLEGRAQPGTDISDLDQDEAIAVAVELGSRLWRPAGAPFRPAVDHVLRWLDKDPSPLTEHARELVTSLGSGEWLVHGDFHHHNVLRHTRGYVAIDPKPYLADREYDVSPWLHTPIPSRLTRKDAERRIAHFAAAGLDEWRIRAWSFVRS